MSFLWGVTIFGIIEICIGLFTLSAVLTSLVIGVSAKPPEVMAFVVITSSISFGLGIGILRRSIHSYHLLLFFSTMVIFSKFLVFARIISLSGALETAIPSTAKNIISVVYHLALIAYFILPAVRKEFGERRNVLFSLTLPFFK